VGGFAGNRVKKGEENVVQNTVAMVGGAVLGGLAGREMEKAWDRRQKGKGKGKRESRGRGREGERAREDDYYD